MLRLTCPVCALDLDRQPRVWHCPQGHSHDVAREGYVNLLPVQQRHSSEPGDSADSLRARRAFLDAGHYSPLREAVVQVLRGIGAQQVLDIGCGEGYYTGAMALAASEVLGLDIAKPAIRLAAKRHPGLTWVVASGAHLPLADGAVDTVCNLFTQLHVAEITRVLAAGGHTLIVTPAADHLQALRAGLFETVQPHEPDKFLSGFDAGFELVQREDVRAPLALDTAGLQQLLAMTPYAWKARPDRRAALEAHEHFRTEAAFTLLLLRKRS
jgi:23S rRNA (guanine745-N1)-methyltransferase